MKRVAILLISLLLPLGLRAQEPDSSAYYNGVLLDTVSFAISNDINNYSMIGFQYGVTSTGMYFNPGHSQRRDIYPGYMSLTFTHFEKMFDYLPYFGFQIGLEYGHEGYHFKENKETGITYEFYKERSQQMKMTVVEVPFLAMIHYDTRRTKFFADVGLYGGYRLSVERFGPHVDPNYKTDWYDTDIRWDYGLQGGAGMGLIFSPFEFIVSAQLRYGWSSIFTPDSMYPAGSGYEDRNRVYYRFAYPLDVMISAGVHIHLSKRTGKTSRDLKRQAKEIVYGEDRKSADSDGQGQTYRRSDDVLDPHQ